MKFKPGTFIELDDQHGGRRVALVCRDGITCTDSMNPVETTPVFIHHVFDPVPLGTLMEFVTAHDLRNAMAAVVDHAVLHEEPLPDALLLVQRLWYLASYGIKGQMTISPDVLNAAKSAADQQRALAMNTHYYAAQYVHAKGH